MNLTYYSKSNTLKLLLQINYVKNTDTWYVISYENHKIIKQP